VLARARVCPCLQAPSFDDYDMVLTTSGHGPVTLMRAFTVPPGSSTVAIRYRFVTQEFPGWYGSQFDDTFSVLVRSKNLGTVVLQDASSLNSIPYSDYTQTGEVCAQCLASSLDWVDAWVVQ
jgi:hypothetical protein